MSLNQSIIEDAPGRREGQGLNRIRPTLRVSLRNSVSCRIGCSSRALTRCLNSGQRQGPKLTRRRGERGEGSNEGSSQKESVEKLAPVHSKQVLTYLRLMNLPVGLLINFGAATLKEGLHRIVNTLPSSAPPHLRVNQSQL